MGEPKGKKIFSTVIHQTISRMAEEDITCYTRGYTRKATIVEYLYESKEYKV